MAVSLPNGAVIHIASGYGAVKTMSALTNADPAVATLEASHGISTGGFLELTSGWSRINEKIVKAGTVATNDVPLLGLKTSNTSIYPAGEGVGSVREITGWTQLQQILNSTSDVGQQNFATGQYLESNIRFRKPTSREPGGLTLSVADDPSLAGYLLASEANDDRLPRAVRITLPSGSQILYNAYITLNKTPTLTVDEFMACEVTMSFLNEPVRV